MKRFLEYIIVISFILIIFLGFIVPKTVTQGNNFYAYEISLIKYNLDGNKNEVRVGKPILIYQRGMFDSGYYTKTFGAKPTTWAHLESGAYGQHQVFLKDDINYNDQDLNYDQHGQAIQDSFPQILGLPGGAQSEFVNGNNMDITGAINQSVDFFNGVLGYEAFGHVEKQISVEVKYNKKDQVTTKPADVRDCFKFKEGNERLGIQGSDSFTEIISASEVEKGERGYIIFRAHFMVPYRRVEFGPNVYVPQNRDTLNYNNAVEYRTYYKRLIAEDIIGDSNTFLANIISKYRLTEPSASMLNYGVAINEKEIKSYYLKVEAVEIVHKEDGVIGTFKVDTIEAPVLDKFKSSVLTGLNYKKYCTYSTNKCSMSFNSSNGDTHNRNGYIYSTSERCSEGCYKNTPASGTCSENEGSYKCNLSSVTGTFSDLDACKTACVYTKKVNGTCSVETQTKEYNGSDYDCSRSIPYNYVYSSEYLTFNKDNKPGMCGKRQEVVLFGYRMKGTKYLITSRAIDKAIPMATRGKYRDMFYVSSHASRTLNLMNEDRNTFCVKDDSDVCIKGLLEHYIGPNNIDAIVGLRASNKYVFDDYSGPGLKAAGARYYPYIDETSTPPIPQCVQLCGNNPTLACAENYCDNVSSVNEELRGSSRERKKDCIINKCKYTDKRVQPEVPPNTLKVVNTTCGVSESGNLKGAHYKLDFEFVDEFDNDKTNDTAFDSRTYIIRKCVDEPELNLKMEPLSNKQGGTISHLTSITNTTTCNFVFDSQQWTFDFATVHSLDYANRRKLLYIYNTFNNLDIQTKALNNMKNYTTSSALAQKYKGSDAIPYRDDIKKTEYALSGDEEFYNELGTVKFNLYFDALQSNVYHTQTEVVNQKEKKSIDNIIAKEEINKASSKMFREYPGTNIKLISNNQVEQLPVRSFKVVDSTIKNYLPYTKCLYQDGTGNWKYSENGVGCESGFSLTNMFLVSNNATANSQFTNNLKSSNASHNVKTNSNVLYQDGQQILKVNDKCEYVIDDVIFSCNINIQPAEDNAKYYGRNLKSGNYNIQLDLTNSKAGAKVKSYNFSFLRNYASQSNMNNIYYLSPDYKKSDVNNIVNGSIEIEYNGKNYEPQCTTNFNSCDNQDKCKLVVVEETSTHKKYRIDTKLSGQKNIIINDVSRMDFDDTVTVELPKCNDSNNPECVMKIEAYVGNREYCCGDDSIKNAGNHSCVRDVEKRGIATEVKQYCDAKWQVDKAQYKSAKDCISKCEICDSDEHYGIDQIDKVEEICKNWKKYGFANIDVCVSKCYNPGTGDIVFRQVSNIDPFPYSHKSLKVHENYTRGVGKNWYSLEKYITDDQNDITSITGPNALSGQVEYVVDLGPNAMKKIRASNKEIGYKYGYKYDRRNNDKDSDPFYSSFIHENPDTSPLFVVKTRPGHNGG